MATLDDYILRKTGPIPEEQAVQLMGQILEGMAYAHGQGIVHRGHQAQQFHGHAGSQGEDLDFGIAKLLEGAVAKHTQTGARIGTVLYMSPEQVRGQETDLRSDIYSLGITLFQMLTGQGPYPSQSTEMRFIKRSSGRHCPRGEHLSRCECAHAGRDRPGDSEATGKSFPELHRVPEWLARCWRCGHRSKARQATRRPSQQHCLMVSPPRRGRRGLRIMI
ncbi:MAG: protein kinase [Bacteroidia bacterium]